MFKGSMSLLKSRVVSNSLSITLKSNWKSLTILCMILSSLRLNFQMSLREKETKYPMNKIFIWKMRILLTQSYLGNRLNKSNKKENSKLNPTKSMLWFPMSGKWMIGWSEAELILLKYGKMVWLGVTISWIKH